MKKRIFEGPTINHTSVGFDMVMFDTGLLIAYAYGKPHIVCSIRSKDLLVSETIKDCNERNRKYNREEIENTYKGILIEINDTLPYGEFLATIPNGEIIVKYKAIVED